MKLTEFFRLRMPDGTDPVNIEDFNDNFEVIDRELKKRISDDGSASDVTVGFEVAESRQPLKSGEKLSVLMGKVHRFFTDLKTVAFSGKYGDLSERPSLGGASTLGVANNCTTTEAGFALDARQGKTLMDKSNELSRDFAGGQMEIRLNSAGEGEYRRKGADTWLPFKRTPSLVAHGVGVSTTVLSRRYAATGNGYIMVAMSSWSNTALTFSVTKNGSSISPSSQDGVADRNKYLYCYVFSVLKGDNIVATVKSSNGKDAADLYLAMFAIV